MIDGPVYTFEQPPLPPWIAEALQPAIPMHRHIVALPPATWMHNGRTAKGRARRS